MKFLLIAAAVVAVVVAGPTRMSPIPGATGPAPILGPEGPEIAVLDPSPITLEPAFIEGPIPEEALIPSPAVAAENSSPLVQIIVNVNGAYGAVSPVAVVDESKPVIDPVQVVDESLVVPEPIVLPPMIVPEPIVLPPGVAPEPIVLPPVVPEPVIINPPKPEPIVIGEPTLPIVPPAPVVLPETLN